MGYKRILTIQDISCVGTCSMTVALPILSACGHETCILPTALLSTHTGGFGTPAVIHFDEMLREILRHWKQCGITFDAVLIGYLGSIPAIQAVSDIADNLLAPGGLLVVDPAMGDHGKLYAGFDLEYAAAMKALCGRADIVLPNITEAAILSGNVFREQMDDCYVNTLLDGLDFPQVVLTGVGYSDAQTGVILQKQGTRQYYPQVRIGTSFYGTGDIFAACFTGALLYGRSSFESVKIAADFTWKCIENTVNSPFHGYGVKFEPVLPELMRMLQAKI